MIMGNPPPPPISRLSLPSSVFRLPLAVLRNCGRRETLVIKTLMMERTLNFSILFLLLTRLLRFALIVLQLIPRRPRFLPPCHHHPLGVRCRNSGDNFTIARITTNSNLRTISLNTLGRELDLPSSLPYLLLLISSTTMSLMMGQ